MKTSTITRLTGVSRATLSNWKKHKPELHEVVEKGCEKQDDNGKYFYRCPVHDVTVYAGGNSIEVTAFLIEKGIITKDRY